MFSGDSSYAIERHVHRLASKLFKKHPGKILTYFREAAVFISIMCDWENLADRTDSTHKAAHIFFALSENEG